MTREDIDLIRFKFFEWLPLPVKERSEKGFPLTITEFAQHHGVSRRVLTKWENEREEEKIIESGTDKEKEEFLLKIKPFAISGMKSKYADLYMKGKGWLIERKEEKLKIDLTASDYIGQAIKLREELRREWESTGSCPICHFSKILRIQPCLDTEPEHTEDN